MFLRVSQCGQTREQFCDKHWLARFTCCRVAVLRMLNREINVFRAGIFVCSGRGLSGVIQGFLVHVKPLSPSKKTDSVIKKNNDYNIARTWAKSDKFVL